MRATGTVPSSVRGEGKRAACLRLNLPMHMSGESQHRTVPFAAKMPGIPELVARSLPMHRIVEQLPQMGRARLILIEGEAGTGKQLLARHIRGLRPSAGSVIADEAGQLFGDEGGWQGGAMGERLASAAERAAQGLLLIRGIDELAAPHQVRLLRFIRSFETRIALGEADAVRAPFQVLATARQPLRAMVLAGRFLPELYYRLSAVCFSFPPLRERREDLPGLVQLLIEAISRERRRPLQGLGPGALAALLHHRWPGNVRELESVIRAACFTAEGQWLRPLDLLILPLESSSAAGSGGPPLPPDLSLSGVMRRHVQSVLKMSSGNKARAATRLGISRSTLYRMLESETENSLPLPGAAEPSLEAGGAPDAEIGASRGSGDLNL